MIRVSGTISLPSMTKVASNKTIEGVGSSSAITGQGLNIANASNVIVRNLNFRSWGDDAINVQYSTRVWIDHNTFSNGYDGAVDVKRASDYVTVSWNKFTSHNKTMLLGHSDDNGSEDRGKLRVTYHHNWFDGTQQRHPRVRFGNPVHVYNNYYGGVTSYGVASTMEAGVLVEGNYFENTEDPFHRGEGSSPGGSLVARSNHFVNSGSGDQGGSVKSLPYSYPLDGASSVKSVVTAGAGAGRG
ncbi:pectate trisaccharide-lyase [Lentzea sp. NBRC 102530]|nr:pectate trisaccharide-lyase [Lentzea sp. NBRC 102530]